MTDWGPGDIAPLPHAPAVDRLAARFVAMLADGCDPNQPTEESDR